MFHSHRKQIRSALTLIELVIAMTIVGMVVASTTGALQLFTLNGSRLQLSERHRSQVSLVMYRLKSELRLATLITDATGTSVTFTVPDITGDAVDDEIEYQWSGTSGDPLTRRLNAEPAQNVLSNVHGFEIVYDIKTTTTESESKSAETLLFSYDPVSDLAGFRVNDERWPGECFEPSLPADATSWSMTRFRVMLRDDGGAKGSTSVQARRARSGSLPGPLIEAVLLRESQLSESFQWEEFSFANVSGLAPDEGLCVVLQHLNDNHSCAVQYQTSGATTPGAAFVSSFNGGGSWFANGTRALSLYVWGTYMLPDASTVSGELKRARIRLESHGSENALPVNLDSAVICLNRPSIG